MSKEKLAFEWQPGESAGSIETVNRFSLQPGQQPIIFLELVSWVLFKGDINLHYIICTNAHFMQFVL